MGIATEQGNIPLNSYPAKTHISIALNGEVAEKVRGQFNILLLRNAAQERRLILNWVTDEVCDLHRNTASIMQIIPKLQCLKQFVRKR